MCGNGKWGPGCQLDCHCSVQCDRVTGHCPSECDPGWMGEDCQQGKDYTSILVLIIMSS